MTIYKMRYQAKNIARYIIKHEQDGERRINAVRLQKLLFFVQVKFIIETNAPCFYDNIEAWSCGAVVTSVYNQYAAFAGFDITERQDVNVTIDEKTSERIDDILDFCARYPTYQLSEIIKNQTPYKRAMNNYFSNVITVNSIKQYYEQKKLTGYFA